MEAFLTRALSKIRDELKISTSKSAKRVADACSEALGCRDSRQICVNQQFISHVPFDLYVSRFIERESR